MAYSPKNPNGQATMANSEPVVLASDQSTVPISAASLPLPSGAATSAAQATLETDVEAINTRLGEVQASPTANTVLDRLKALLTELALKADLTETQPVSLASVPSHDVTNAGTFSVQNTAATPAGNNNIGDVDIASIAAGDNNIGNVDIASALPAGTNNIGDVDVLTVPSDPFGANADAASATGSISAKLKAIATALGVTALDLGSGTGGSRTLRVFQDTAQFVGGTGTDTSATQRVSLATDVALPAGTNAIGKLAANSGVDIGDVDVTSIAAGTNNIGQVSVAPQTANGLSVFNATSSDGATALTSTAQAIKASAGQVYGWYIYNPNASAQFVQFYNVAAASVTVGTTSPLFMLTIPATSAANVEFTNGITFSNAGFSCAATSTAGGNGAPSTALDCVIFYK